MKAMHARDRNALTQRYVGTHPSVIIHLWGNLCEPAQGRGAGSPLAASVQVGLPWHSHVQSHIHHEAMAK